MRAFDRAADVDSTGALSLNRALVYVRWKRYREAFEILDRLSTMTPDSRTVHRERGWCLHHMGRYEEALSAYDRAASLGAYGQPIEPWSLNFEDKCWYYRGATYMALERYEEALSDLSHFVKARPEITAAEPVRQQVVCKLQKQCA